MKNNIDNIKTIEQIEWHDGQLVKIEICFSRKSFIIITALIYESDKSKVMAKIELKFFTTGNLSTSLDFNELLRNSKFGNISNGYIKSTARKRKFFIYLSDGFLSFNFRRVEILHGLNLFNVNSGHNKQQISVSQ